MEMTDTKIVQEEIGLNLCVVFKTACQMLDCAQPQFPRLQLLFNLGKFWP